MTVQLVMALSDNNVIGVDGHLPWHIPFDLKWFKMNTYGSIVIMGRKTWESLPQKPLPGRLSIVLSRTRDKSDDCLFCQSWLEALAVARNMTLDIYIIGGSSIYKQALLLNIVDGLIVTRVHTTVQGHHLTHGRLPFDKTLYWQSQTFQHQQLHFHFELYRCNRERRRQDSVRGLQQAET